MQNKIKQTVEFTMKLNDRIDIKSKDTINDNSRTT